MKVAAEGSSCVNVQDRRPSSRQGRRIGHLAQINSVPSSRAEATKSQRSGKTSSGTRHSFSGVPRNVWEGGSGGRTVVVLKADRRDLRFDAVSLGDKDAAMPGRY